MSKKYFASDNYSPVDPFIMDKIMESNNEYAKSYGNDLYTQELNQEVKRVFGKNATIYPTLTGTGSNIIALQTITKRHQAVVAPATSHINVDEGGSPEKFGIKIYTIHGRDGKLDPNLLSTQAWGYGDVHRAQPSVLSISQSTELGTVYKIEELKKLISAAKERGMLIHMDGARLFNAAATLNIPIKEFTTDLGVDILALGGTKNGALAAEAVVLLNQDFSQDLPYLRKSSAQLYSKQRFTSVQHLALLKNDYWKKNAENANQMALYLRELLASNEEIRFAFPTESNALFAYLSPDLAAKLSEKYNFYIWEESSGLVRWMTSWDTERKDVEDFATSLLEDIKHFYKK